MLPWRQHACSAARPENDSAPNARLRFAPRPGPCQTVARLRPGCPRPTPSEEKADVQGQPFAAHFVAGFPEPSTRRQRPFVYAQRTALPCPDRPAVRPPFPGPALRAGHQDPAHRQDPGRAALPADLLSDKRAMLYFAQPSTRTFLSFYAACQILGMHPAEVRDTTTSSEFKGESPEDSVRTFSSYFDLIIMRHPVGGFAERIAWLLSNTERGRSRSSTPARARTSTRRRPCWTSTRCSAASRSAAGSTARRSPSWATSRAAARCVRWPGC